MKKLRFITNRKRKTAAILLTMFISIAPIGCSTQETSANTPEIVPAKPTYSEKPSGNSTEIAIGSLTLTIPLGWKMEQHLSDDGIAQYILSDIHSECKNEEINGHKDGYEHEITITPYTIAQMPELTLQLAAEMKEYFATPVLYGVRTTATTDGIKGCWMYGQNPDTWEDEYFLFSDKGDGKKELFHISEGDNYVTSCSNEVETFEEFMDNGFVRTNNGNDTADRHASNSGQKEYYFLLNQHTDTPLLVAIQYPSGDMAVYRKGSYETVLTELPESGLYPRNIGVADIDQDGYEDILYRRWLLRLTYSPDFTCEEEFEGYLWNEENSTFVYVPGKEMLAQYGAIWEEREKGKDAEPPDTDRIPEELTAHLSESMQKSTEELRDAMLALVSDRELSMEEVKKLAKNNADIKREMLAIASSYDYEGIWLKADADNDGIEDVFLCEYLGGTLGMVYYHLFSGKENGDYERVAMGNGLKTEFSFINWEGKNYLAKTTFEFTKKQMDGISLEYLENGTCQEKVWLAITPKEGDSARSIQTSYVAKEQYRSLENALIEFSKQYQSGDRAPLGTAETESDEEGYNRNSDMNNDGKMENYTVSLWQTSNYYTVDNLIFYTEDGEIDQQFRDIMKESISMSGGIDKNLWVDETEYGNVIYVLYEDGLYDFHICGYLLSETDCQKLIQVDCHVQTEVTVMPLSENYYQ